MAVTVEDLLQVAFPPGARVVGGRAGLRRMVTWARSLRPRPPAFEALEGGELALISSAHLSLLEESMTMSRVVARLGEVGVAAVAVLGEVDEETIGVAEKLAMPLIQMPEGTSLIEVERAAVATIVDRQAELQRRGSDVYRQLAQLVFEERGLQAVAERLAEVSGRSVSIEDDQFRVQFAAAGRGLPHPEELDLRASGAEIRKWTKTVALSSTQPPVGRFLLIGCALARFVAPIAARDGVAGYLSLIGPDPELGELDRLTAGRGAAACAVQVAKEAAVDEAEARVRGDLLDQLLLEELEGDQAALGKARRLGYDPSVPSLVMVFKAEAADKTLAGVPTRGVDRISRQLESLVRVEMSRREPKSLVAARGNVVVTVVPLQATTSDRSAKQLAEDVRSSAQALLDDCLVAAGVGRSTDGGASLAVAYREAERALGIGVRIRGVSSTTHFGELGILRLLVQVDNVSELEGFYHEMLGKLDEHDRKAGGETLRTLEALFRCHGNLSKTAEDLTLHRNSLLYRLQRIEEISGLDLGDPETRLSLQVALKVRQMLDAERARRGG